MKFTLIIHILVLHILKGVFGIRIIELKVPRRVRSNENIQLSCHFDLEGKSLYSLTWWKGVSQFYQYSPTTMQSVYNATGIQVDEASSSLQVVVLRNVSRGSSGIYKCEVVADFPSFERDSMFKVMEVVEVPPDPPRVSIDRIHFEVGDILEANCTSAATKPPSILMWFINGEKISDRFYHGRLNTRHWHGSREVVQAHDKGINARGIKDRRGTPLLSSLRIVLRKDNFHEGRSEIVCAATLHDLYYVPRAIQLSHPGITPFIPSLRISGESCTISLRPQLFFPLLFIYLLEYLHNIITQIYNPKLLYD